MIRNVKTRYKRSALFESRVPHYPVYLLVGLLLWNFVAQTTTSAMNEMVWSSGLLKRVYMPRAIFVVAAGTGLVNLVIALIPLTAIALLTGVRSTPAWLFLPVAALLAAAFATGSGVAAVGQPHGISGGLLPHPGVYGATAARAHRGRGNVLGRAAPSW